MHSIQCDKATKRRWKKKKTFLFICCSRKTFSGLIKLVPCLHFKNIFQFQLLDSHSTKGNILRYVYYYNQWEISFDGIFVPLSSLLPSHFIPMLTNLQLNLKLFHAWNDYTIRPHGICTFAARRRKKKSNDNFRTSSLSILLK